MDRLASGWLQRSGTSIDIVFVRLDDEERRVRDPVDTRFLERDARFSLFAPARPESAAARGSPTDDPG